MLIRFYGYTYHVGTVSAAKLRRRRLCVKFFCLIASVQVSYLWVPKSAFSTAKAVVITELFLVLARRSNFRHAYIDIKGLEGPRIFEFRSWQLGLIAARRGHNGRQRRFRRISTSR